MNTDYLAVFGKALQSSGEEFPAETRILRRCIQDLRENLLIGSACYNGECLSWQPTGINRIWKRRFLSMTTSRFSL
ncbi:MAG: hypothetical protein ACLSA6_16950 [Holdemania massiliensis]